MPSVDNTAQDVLVEHPKNIFEKCETCKKKVMFSGKCKCENYYCDRHRYNHTCSFSHFHQHKEMLAKKNPKIENEKLVRF